MGSRIINKFNLWLEFTVTAGNIPEGCVRGVLGLPLSPEMDLTTWLRRPEAVLITYS